MPEQASKLPTELFSLEGQIAVVTGGTGVLGGAMGRGLARAGAKVGVLGRRRERAEAAVRAIEKDGGAALALPADVLDRGELEAAREASWNSGGDSICSSTPPVATCPRPHLSRGNPASIYRSRAWSR